MTRIRLEGTEELREALRNMSDDIAAKVGEVVMETAANVEAGVKLRIAQGPATGRVYTRGSVSHTASAPGEAPASDTGVLLGSIYHENKGPLSAIVGSRIAYAAYLEFGTRRIAPRPAWVPEVEQTRPEFVNDIRAALGRAVT